jgi:hypothetical protein
MADGRQRLRLKTSWRDGTTHLALSGLRRFGVTRAA